MPAWWIRAYEAAVLSEADGASAMTHAVRAGLAPAFSPVEMNALAAILASLQEQILVGKHQRLAVVTEEHLKHAGTASKPRRLLFEKVVQILTGVRLLSVGDDGATESQRLFAADAWRLEDDGNATVELKPALLGLELVLGFGDAHLDLVRVAQGEKSSQSVLGEAAPLTLARSLWLDLAGIDQMLLLRLERAMQWQCRWLQLEGVFGMPVSELFQGVQLGEPKGRDVAGGELAQRLRALARLGKKLSAHGVLQGSQADCYLAVAEAEEKELSLVWQLTRERLASETMMSYRQSVATFTATHRYGDFLEPLLRLFVPKAPRDDELAGARALWERLSLVEDAPAEISGLEHTPSQMLSPRVLFFELLQRQQQKSKWPLPEALLRSPIGPLLASHPGEEGVALLGFSRLLDESPDLLRALRDVPMATLTSQASLKDRDLQLHLQGLLKPRASVVVSTPATTIAPDSQIDSVSDKDDVPAESAPRRKGAVSGALASRMLRIASDELARMRTAHPDRFSELKRAYLNSLDEVGRRLMLDVQKRMQQSLFEEHLRQRLVRFMVENPGSWRSSEGVRREASERF